MTEVKEVTMKSIMPVMEILVFNGIAVGIKRGS